jgi:rhodanese-related sulfurtransferase
VNVNGIGIHQDAESLTEENVMKRIFAGLICILATSVMADLSALMVIEPTLRKDGLMVSRSGLEASLSKLLGQNVNVVNTDELTDAMRATRSGGYDIFIGPPQVIASAIGHGYELIGSTDAEEQYLLIGRKGIQSAADLRQRRIYLPQQDSIYTYLARGLLTANGLSFKDLKKIEYARYPQAGLIAISLNLAEATVVRRDHWDQWQVDNGGAAKVLATVETVPGGLSVAIKNDLPADLRMQIVKWFATQARSCGMKPVIQHAELSSYKNVANMGNFTPTILAGVTVVWEEDVKRLIGQGATLVDTRTENEFKRKHIPGAVLVPYHEKSLKDVAYDAGADAFPGLRTLNSQTPTVFICNGPECWKSYKASRAAVAAGFAKVYWYRGGMPDWEKTGQLVAGE